MARVAWCPFLVAGVLPVGCGGGTGAPQPSITANRPCTLLGASGNPSVVTDGRLAAEGAPAGAAAVSFDQGVGSAAVLDLGAARPVAALLVQVGASDVYFVEGSVDAESWGVLWRVPPLYGVSGLRTRTTVLPKPVRVRWLRVRPTTTRAPTMSELEAFETAPSIWPSIDRSRPGARLPLFPELTGDRIRALLDALSAVLMLAVGWCVLARQWLPSGTRGRARRGTLVAVAVASLAAWPNALNFHYFGTIHTWEFFHYYLGAKYFPETGYTRLYLCAATVDVEDGIDLSGHVMRDLRDNRIVPAAPEPERSAECRAHFTAARWDEFRRDAHFFREAMGDAWISVRRDHGFNATPAWTLVGGALARAAPASWRQMELLALLDALLLGLMFAVIARAFGLEAVCIAAGFWSLNTLSLFGWTGGGFLRYDWVFWLVLGIAALRTERPALAGFALAYSSVLRVFPVCSIAALALKAVLAVVTERSLRPLRNYGRFVAGCLATTLLLVGGSWIAGAGPEVWKEFSRNSSKHLSTPSANLVGLRAFLGYDSQERIELVADPLLADPHAVWSARRSAAERETGPAWWAAAGAFVLLLGLAVRAAPDWLAAVLGIGLMPILPSLSSYYYAAFVVYALLWPASGGAGFALAAFTWVSNVIFGLWAAPDQRYAWLSLAVVVLAAGMSGGFAWRSRPAAARRGRHAGPDSADSRPSPTD